MPRLARYAPKANSYSLITLKTKSWDCYSLVLEYDFLLMKAFPYLIAPIAYMCNIPSNLSTFSHYNFFGHLLSNFCNCLLLIALTCYDKFTHKSFFVDIIQANIFFVHIIPWNIILASLTTPMRLRPSLFSGEAPTIFPDESSPIQNHHWHHRTTLNSKTVVVWITALLPLKPP